MSNKRLIAVILLEDDKVIQSENFNHTNVIHYSSKIAIETFSQWRVDEIIILNISKKKDEKKFLEVLRNILKKCFVPITVGGWIDNMDFAKQIFKTAPAENTRAPPIMWVFKANKTIIEINIGIRNLVRKLKNKGSCQSRLRFFGCGDDDIESDSACGFDRVAGDDIIVPRGVDGLSNDL